MRSQNYLVLITDGRLALAVGAALEERLAEDGRKAAALVPAVRGTGFTDSAARGVLGAWRAGLDPIEDAPHVVALEEDGLLASLASLGLPAYVGVRDSDKPRIIRWAGDAGAILLPVATARDLVDAIARHVPWSRHAAHLPLAEPPVRAVKATPMALRARKAGPGTLSVRPRRAVTIATAAASPMLIASLPPIAIALGGTGQPPVLAAETLTTVQTAYSQPASSPGTGVPPGWGNLLDQSGGYLSQDAGRSQARYGAPTSSASASASSTGADSFVSELDGFFGQFADAAASSPAPAPWEMMFPFGNLAQSSAGAPWEPWPATPGSATTQQGGSAQQSGNTTSSITGGTTTASASGSSGGGTTAAGTGLPGKWFGHWGADASAAVQSGAGLAAGSGLTPLFPGVSAWGQAAQQFLPAGGSSATEASGPAKTATTTATAYYPATRSPYLPNPTPPQPIGASFPKNFVPAQIFGAAPPPASTTAKAGGGAGQVRDFRPQTDLNSPFIDDLPLDPSDPINPDGDSPIKLAYNDASATMTDVPLFGLPASGSAAQTANNGSGGGTAATVATPAAVADPASAGSASAGSAPAANPIAALDATVAAADPAAGLAIAANPAADVSPTAAIAAMAASANPGLAAAPAGTTATECATTSVQTDGCADASDVSSSAAEDPVEAADVTLNDNPVDSGSAMDGAVGDGGGD